MEEKTSSCFYKSRPTLVIDPHNFFAQIGTESTFAEFSHFELMVQQHCEGQTESPKPQEDGQLQSRIVFVKSPRLAKWLRAEVARINGEMLDVCYVDYGTTELVAMDSVCTDVPIQLQSQPPQAFRCCLFGIQPIAKSWTSRAVKCFQTLVQDETLDTLILSSHYGTLNVALYANEEKDERCITHLLLEEEVGLPCDIDRIPEYKRDVYFPDGVPEHEAEEQRGEGEEGMCGSDVISRPPIPLARIPSFDTRAIETSHEVTPEVLKIGAIIESQENTRSHLKRQLKDMSSEIASDISLHTGLDASAVGCERKEVDDHADLIDDILSQIQKTKSATDTDDDPADEQRPGRMRKNSKVTEDRHRRSHRYSSPLQRNYSSSSGPGNDRSRLKSNSPVPPRYEQRRNSPSSEHVKAGCGLQNGLSIGEGADLTGEQNDLIQQPESKGSLKMSPQQFSSELHTMLVRIKSEGLEDHHKDFDDLVLNNLKDGRLSEVMEAVLEMSVKQYDTFCPAALVILPSFQNDDNFGECVSSILWKLQAKYCKVIRRSYLHTNYSKLLGELFVASEAWEEGAAHSLRICVLNTLQKWIIFNKKNTASTNEALLDVFCECFLAVWEIAGDCLYRTMFGEWQQIVYEMQDRILSSHIPRSVRRSMLELLISRPETPTLNCSTAVTSMTSSCEIGCQASPKMVDVSTQRSRNIKDSSHVGCQVDLLNGKTFDGSEKLLLTPEELTKTTPEKMRSLQGPERFFVPRYTLPIPADALSADSRVAHVPMVLAGSFRTGGDGPGMSRGSRSSSPASRGRGRATRKPLPPTTSPFYDPSLHDRVSTEYDIVLKHVADESQFTAVNSGRSRSEKRRSPVAEEQPRLMTPDLFSSPPSTKNISHHQQSPVQDATCNFDIFPKRDSTVPSLTEDTKNRIPTIIRSSEHIKSIHSKSPGPDAKAYLPKDPVSLFEKGSNRVASDKESHEADKPTAVVPVSKQTKPKPKKKVLVDLRTGKSLSKNRAEISPPTFDITARQILETDQQTSFSYADIAVRNTANQKPEKTLTLKNLADDWLKKPEENHTVVNDDAYHTDQMDPSAAVTSPVWRPTTKTDSHSRSNWAASASEFPSLQEIELVEHSKGKVGDGKANTEAEEKHFNITLGQFIDASDPATRWEDDDKDLVESGDTGDTSESQRSGMSSPKRPPRPLWNPGPRKCTICGDENHLVYDCPKKNRLLLY